MEGRRGFPSSRFCGRIANSGTLTLFCVRLRQYRRRLRPPTSRVRPFPTSVVLPAALRIAGVILTSHIGSIDTIARPIRYAGAVVPPGIAQLVRAKLDAFIII